ncbi:hypothetical protein [Cytobacillus firmus]|uniref:Amino acid transporter n=1 Tax=Cytobacillus firmus DS1 TaxID=1307436 RepID=W7LFZ8_CYTFI|nr:hypothetical protein [Cytobacillus firmus]EWG10934.1 amino acid transporter [Cytobacillus firmus DS1]
MNISYRIRIKRDNVVISPGIDTALITKRTIADGRADGYNMALGKQH